MALTQPIPPQAADVVEFIRWWVPRPKKLPHPSSQSMRGALGFGPDNRCPLGLCPLATFACPVGPVSAGLSEDDAERKALGASIDMFICWWDSQTDPQAAVDAVWPVEE